MKLHPDTFEISQQRVLGWRLDHSNRTPYHVLANTYRFYAPDISKIIAVLEAGILEKKADMTRYASDWSYVAECKEYIALFEQTLVMIQEVSVERYQKEQEIAQRLEEIDVEYRKRIDQARAYDLRLRSGR